MFQPVSATLTEPPLSLVHVDEEITGTYAIGALGRLIELHGLVYHERCGFDQNFEIFVAKELAEFLSNFTPECDGLWLYKQAGTIMGSIAIDGHASETEGARLRFLVLDEKARGRGIGQQLMQRALNFCQSREMKRIFLWTAPSLYEARGLYDKFGFALVSEIPHEGWGRVEPHQRFELTLK